MTARLRWAFLGACVVAALAAPVTAALSPASNKRAAARDAQTLLARLQLPAGASRSEAEPSGDGGHLKPTPSLNATSARSDDHAWWLVPGSPDAAVAFIKSHPPSGSTLDGTGAMYAGGTLVDQSADFAWPAIPRVLGERELAVTVMALADGETGLLAQSQSNWIVPRPRTERIPAATHEIDISSALVNGPTTVALSVTGEAKVRSIVALLDSMPIVQPAVYHCPALIGTGARLIGLDFRAATGGELLARATYVAYRGLAYSSGPCNPIELMIGADREKPLLGGDFLRRIQRVLGVSLLG